MVLKAAAGTGGTRRQSRTVSGVAPRRSHIRRYGSTRSNCQAKAASASSSKVEEAGEVRNRETRSTITRGFCHGVA